MLNYPLDTKWFMVYNTKIGKCGIREALLTDDLPLVRLRNIRYIKETEHSPLLDGYEYVSHSPLYSAYGYENICDIYVKEK
uniref:Uncharacterized protein n=1 Tax=Aeromonas phage vB_AdhaM_G2 TaxID=3238786 RepID=A0AB39TZ05_9CAUD